MKDFYGNNWQAILNENGLADFNALWDIEATWFEEPNQRRGGWSGVSKIKLVLPNDGGEVWVFLKRQQNHITKTICHPVRGIPTFQREFRNIQRFIKHDLPTAEPVYFGHRVHEGALQAILITRELEGYQSLNLKQFVSGSEFMAECPAILMSLAMVMRKMHKHHLQHNSFYPKHVFIKKLDGVWDIRLIDLEKMKWRFFKRRATIRDLGTLYRRNERIYILGLSNQILFFKTYMNEQKLSVTSKQIWRMVRKTSLVKKKRVHD